jgi:hypothetical protein
MDPALFKGDMLMKIFLSLMLAAGMAFGTQAAVAQQAASAPAKPAKPAKKTHATKKAQPKQADGQAGDADDEGKEPDTAGSVSTDFNCELGNKLTIYRNDGDDKHIGLRWKQRLHRLTRVDTSTGASRFENRKFGLVWIGIPAKGMLLDSKQGRQLANECKDPLQVQQEQNTPKG